MMENCLKENEKFFASVEKKKKKRTRAREQRGTRMMIGERTAAVSDKFQAS